jgi:hypothetical protein
MRARRARRGRTPAAVTMVLLAGTARICAIGGAT